MTDNNVKPMNPQELNSDGATESEPSLVVGVGASAGGVSALRDFFKEVPKDSDMAYVVILHISPEYDSKLAEILQQQCPIPVTQVKQREKVTPNHVYVIPPNRNLEMTDGHVEPTEFIRADDRRSPVDVFFRTLAETTEHRAVSVVLSGSGADGTLGLKRIKEFGGVAFAQDPEQAEYRDMPRNAIATGLIDHVLPVGDIPAKIASYKDRLPIDGFAEIDSHETDEQALSEIFTQLRRRTGQDFSNYKRATLLRRIARRTALLELDGLSEYSHYIHRNAVEVKALMKELLISVTNFFRDPDAIEAFNQTIVPRLLDQKVTDEPLRVWVAGCATGEEAYSLAMLLVEHAEKRAGTYNIQIFATDLDEQAIRVAREGFYRDAEVTDVSPERLRRFFNREPEGYRVKRELREIILFAVHNVIKDPPFSHLDLVSCRNLLIYLNRIAQARVLEVLHFSLKQNGYLFLGASESVEGSTELFTVVSKEHHFFQARPAAAHTLLLPQIPLKPPSSLTIEKDKTPEQVRALERLSFADLHQRLLEQYAAPSLIVNEQYDIVRLSNRAGRYLQLVGGEPTYNLLKVIRPELRLELRTALYQAVNDRINVETPPLQVSTDEGFEVVNVVVRPVVEINDGNRGFILVLFEPATSEKAAVTEIAASTEPLAARLETELVHLKSQLRATVEQYEVQQEELRASNEELQAMNEELRSAAEELETSKEELQSINEELHTVNQELKVKIDELSLANNNFQNLMNSTNIGTIFLTRDLRVKQFTPSARDTFNLIVTDLGRSLTDITHKLKYNHLLDDLDIVLTNLQTIEREVETIDDRTYMMRISPYRTMEDRIDGLVITLVDVTDRARAVAKVRQAAEELEGRVSERTRDLGEANETLKREIAERKRSEEVRVQLLGKLVTAQEQERQRFARELHDQLGQQLTVLRLKLDGLRSKTKSRSVPAGPINELQDIVKKLDDDVDFLAWELRPVALEELGLKAALANYVKQWSSHFGIEISFHSSIGERRFPHEIESNLYRIVQEALNNCAKHSKCKRADVILEERDKNIVLVIEDNGVGFDPNEEPAGTRHLGLVGMRERVILMGGRFEVESTPDKGATILIRVPHANT